MPLLVGLWVPFTLVVKALMSTGTLQIDLPVVGIYSALAWSLLAVIVGTTSREPSFGAQPVAQTSRQYQAG